MFYDFWYVSLFSALIAQASTPSPFVSMPSNEDFKTTLLDQLQPVLDNYLPIAFSIVGAYLLLKVFSN
jgi:hypothetical protein